MNHALTNKRALIAGGSRGIGAAIARPLASEGAHVALTYSSSPDQANPLRQGYDEAGEIVRAAQAFGVLAIAYD